MKSYSSLAADFLSAKFYPLDHREFLHRCLRAEDGPDGGGEQGNGDNDDDGNDKY